MTDVYITVDSADKQAVENIQEYFKDNNNAVVTVQEPWPVMSFGESFHYNNTQYTFLKYMSRDKARCVNTNVLLNHAVIQVEYFDCSKISSNLQFFK